MIDFPHLPPEGFSYSIESFSARYDAVWIINHSEFSYRDTPTVEGYDERISSFSEAMSADLIETHIAKDKEILDNPMISPNQRRHGYKQEEPDAR